MERLTSLEAENTGVCVKSSEGVVAFQNSLCVFLCGDQTGRTCAKGCMLRFQKATPGSALDQGVRLLRNVSTDKGLVDAVMINDEGSLTTLLFDKSSAVQKQLTYLKQFNLSKSELQIMEKFLMGISHREVAAQLYICKATLRTHLNNIYKKIPEKVKLELLSAHLAEELGKR